MAGSERGGKQRWSIWWCAAIPWSRRRASAPTTSRSPASRSSRLPRSGSLPVPDGARLIDATGKIVMPGGIDPHVHCKWHLPNPDGSAALTDPPDVVGRAAVHGGTTTMIDFTRAIQGANLQDAIEKREEDWKGHCACDYAQHIMVEGALPLDLSGPVGRGDPGRLSDGEDLHHRHHAVAQGAHGGFRRHLGSVPGAEAERRPRRDPLRGQRHRDAHVRQADPRGAHRLRQHGRGAQHAVGGHLVPPRDPAGREGRRRALHDAHLGRVRRVGDPRGARARRADLRRVAAPVHALHVARTTSGRTARSITPTRR